MDLMIWIAWRARGPHNAPTHLARVQLQDDDGAPTPFEELEQIPGAIVDELKLGPGDWRWGRLLLSLYNARSQPLPPRSFVGEALVRLTDAQITVRYLPGLRDARGWTGGTGRPATVQTWRAIRSSTDGLPAFRTNEDLDAYLDTLDPA